MTSKKIEKRTYAKDKEVLDLVVASAEQVLKNIDESKIDLELANHVKELSTDLRLRILSVVDPNSLTEAEADRFFVEDEDLIDLVDGCYEESFRYIDQMNRMLSGKNSDDNLLTQIGLIEKKLNVHLGIKEVEIQKNTVADALNTLTFDETTSDLERELAEEGEIENLNPTLYGKYFERLSQGNDTEILEFIVETVDSGKGKLLSAIADAKFSEKLTALEMEVLFEEIQDEIRLRGEDFLVYLTKYRNFHRNNLLNFKLFVEKLVKLRRIGADVSFGLLDERLEGKDADFSKFISIVNEIIS